MAVQKQIDEDLRAAMLSGDKAKTDILRVLKSAFLYEALNTGSQDKTITDEQAQKVLAKEAKKRAEAAELYKQAGHQERYDNETNELKVIESYLPEQMSEADLKALVDRTIAEMGVSSQADMGRVIGAVRQSTGAAADGALIAKLVREALSQ
jgi:uncharacterized protein YqeY